MQLIEHYAKCCISVLKILALVQVCHAHVRKDGRLSLCICVSEWGTLGTRQHAKVCMHVCPPYRLLLCELNSNLQHQKYLASVKLEIFQDYATHHR